MKRSEMLDKISYVFWPFIEEGSCVGLSEAILSMMEKEGMTPPTYEYTPKTDLGNGIYASHDVLVKIYGKWEPEND